MAIGSRSCASYARRQHSSRAAIRWRGGDHTAVIRAGGKEGSPDRIAMLMPRLAPGDQARRGRAEKARAELPSPARTAKPSAPAGVQQVFDSRTSRRHTLEILAIYSGPAARRGVGVRVRADGTEEGGKSSTGPISAPARNLPGRTLRKSPMTGWEAFRCGVVDNDCPAKSGGIGGRSCRRRGLRHRRETAIESTGGRVVGTGQEAIRVSAVTRSTPATTKKKSAAVPRRRWRAEGSATPAECR